MSRPWMPLYVADYLADTGHLSAAEHGAYLLLIMHYWANQWLPTDDRRLARIARMSPEEWGEAKATLQEFFDADWKHTRIEFELTQAAQKSAQAKAAAAASAEVRKKGADERTLSGRTSGRTSGRSADVPTDVQAERQRLQSQLREDSEANASGADAPDDEQRLPDPEPEDDPPIPDPAEPEREYFARGREILGSKAGGLLAKLLKAKGGNVALARSALELASTKQTPVEFIGAACRGPPAAGQVVSIRDEQRMKLNAALDRAREYADKPEDGGALGGPTLALIPQRGRG